MKDYRVKGKIVLSLMSVVSMLVFMTGIAAAKTTATMKEEKKLKSEITMLNKDAKLPHGEQVLTEKLTKEFNVTPDQVKALRDKKLGYGEITSIYAFADKMPGGVTEDNVNKVVSMHQGKKGWMTIAKSLNVDLGSVTSKVKGIAKDTRSDIKKASAETGAAGGGGAGGGKSKSGGGGY